MEFIAKGRVTLSGVTFYIEADNIEEARQMAVEGTFDRFEWELAAMDDLTINEKTVEENE